MRKWPCHRRHEARWTVMETMIVRPAIVTLLIAVLVFMVMRAPVYLPRLDPNAPPVPAGDSYVFGFATLTNPLVRLVVVGRFVPTEPAQLRGLQRLRRDLRDAPDTVLEGVRFRVSPQELIRLDRYERTGRKYRRDLMELEDGTKAWVYRLLEETGIEAVQD
ncbi:MAG: gamma-glutamylcyclotransferase [Rhodobacteraceae bacterium]|nr:MAG: gamma-glutamylcyclotransferase [Paracoccaceae bacterium]